MKVLFVHAYDDNIAGQEVSLVDRLGALREAGVTCEILLPGTGVFYQQLVGMGYRVHLFPLERLRSQTRPLSYLRTVTRLALLLLKGRYSVAHCSGAYPHQYVFPAARLARVPTVVHINTGAYTDYCYRSSLIRWADRVICVSKKVRDKVLEMTKMAPNRLRVVYDGVSAARLDEEDKDRDGLRLELGVPAENLLVGQLATVIPRKGFDVLVEAAGRVVPQFERVTFMLMGRTYGDDYEAKLRQRIAEQGIEDQVIFVGFHEAYPRYLDLLDISVLASRAEGLPRILVESQMMGKPVVGTAVDGIAETVRDRETGLLVPSDDPDAMATAILELRGPPAHLL
jgi:glycosyltransferase involved in cell wall biosynthesis